MIINHKKNQPLELVFPMSDVDNAGTHLTGLAPSVEGHYHDGAGWQAANPAGAIAELGATGQYALTLTAGDLNHDYVVLKFTAAGAADSTWIFRMGALALDDLDQARQMVTNNRQVNGSTGVTTIMADDGVTPAYTITPDEASPGVVDEVVADA